MTLMHLIVTLILHFYSILTILFKRNLLAFRFIIFCSFAYPCIAILFIFMSVHSIIIKVTVLLNNFAILQIEI